MLDLLKFILTNAGISYIVTKSTLFNGFRSFLKNRSIFFWDLFRCPLCFGFWSSIFSFFVIYNNYIYFLLENNHIFMTLAIYFCYCCIGSITSYIIYGIISRL